ncbi:hypothetical protein [Streptococcus sp. 20-1249]|uniref:hypothetical protein n=1 Tax=Streptococcus hepaticus TaxID=3349163 RepID=UPI0037490B4C
MRLKQNRLNTRKVCSFVVKKDDEGNKTVSYDYEHAREVKLETWPAGGRLQAEIYGERLNYILNGLAEKSAEIAEKDGVCIDSEKVTHKVISKKPYTDHIVLELEYVGNR